MAGKKRGPKKGEGGRPKIELDYDLIAKLAQIQCTQVEIAQIIGVCVDTLQRDEYFSGIYKTGIEKGKSSLRRLQWKAAENGNNAMLIWLGKQYLGQREKVDNSMISPDGSMSPGGKIQVEFVRPKDDKSKTPAKAE